MTTKQAVKHLEKLLEFYREEDKKYVFSMFHSDMINRLKNEITRLNKS